MNLAILHYHVNRGGVTRVVENQLRALDSALAATDPDGAEPWSLAIIHGGRDEGFDRALLHQLEHLRVSLHVVPELEYDELQVGGSGPAGGAELLMALMQVLGELAFVPSDTVLHVHNHSLGKNRAVAEVLPVLAGDGYALLLQMHDFAEDFRPANYAKVVGAAREKMLYPQARHIHCAVLNDRDREILTAGGIPTDRLHLLPNPVPELSALPERAASRAKLAERFDVSPEARVLLYPVRCIRRKNMGEALLLGLLGGKESVVALTLAPLNPVEVPAYQAWRQLADELSLPCRFEVGGEQGLTFLENLSAADAVVTTSLAEGFGMVFLEAWLAGRPLVGRDLPEITRDFRAAGVDYPWLYDRLNVPLAWIGEAEFLEHLRVAYGETMVAYGRPEPDDLDIALREKIIDGTVDFGDLDAPLQQQVVRRASGDPAAREELLALNPELGNVLAQPSEEAAGVIDANRRVIHQRYSREPSGARLLQLYREVAASPRDDTPEPLPGKVDLLGRFLSPRRFRPLRR